MTVQRRPDHTRLGDGQPTQARVPPLLGSELELEDDPPLLPERLRVRALAGDAQLPAEGAEGVRGHQLPFVVRPGDRSRRTPAITLPADGAHVEHVREIEFHGHRQLEANGLARMVDEVVVLMDAFLDRARQGERQAGGLELQVGRGDPGVGHHVPRRIEANGAGVEQLRSLAGERQLVARDEARVTRVEPAVAAALDAAIRLSDEHVVVAVDGDVGRADLYCVDHSESSCDRSPLAATRFRRASRRSAAGRT